MKITEELYHYVLEGVMIVLAITIVSIMVTKADRKKKEAIPFHYNVHLLEKHQVGF